MDDWLACRDFSYVGKTARRPPSVPLCSLMTRLTSSTRFDWCRNSQLGSVVYSCSKRQEVINYGPQCANLRLNEWTLLCISYCVWATVEKYHLFTVCLFYGPRCLSKINVMLGYVTLWSRSSLIAVCAHCMYPPAMTIHRQFVVTCYEWMHYANINTNYIQNNKTNWTITNVSEF